MFGLRSPILEVINRGGVNYVIVEGGAYIMATSRRIRVKGVRKSEIDSEQLALIYWLQAKRVLRERREREAQEKKKRRERES